VQISPKVQCHSDEAQRYIQLEEAMRASANHSAKRGDNGGKLTSPHEAVAHVQDQNRGQPF